MAKILVVDDEPGVVLWVRYALEFEGYQVVSAGSGGEALAAAGRERADLLILDRMLPDMDGEDVCRALRNMPSTARLPILMFSVRSGEPDRASGPASAQDSKTDCGPGWQQVYRHMLAEVGAQLGDCSAQGRTPANKARVAELLAEECERMGRRTSGPEYSALLEALIVELAGLGPLDSLLADDTISEVMVNGPQQVYIERMGRITAANVRFDDDAHIMRVISRILRPLGRYVGPRNPLVDARLADGSRVNVIIPPGAVDHPTITIRRFRREPMDLAHWLCLGSLTSPMAEFLRACVIARLNVLISGGTGTGKTTLLNTLSGLIPGDERIVTIEDAAELQLQQPHVVRLEAQPPDAQGEGELTVRQLVRNALRMRPDRIIVGEVRGGEALDMLQAMNTGHDGSLATLHSNSPRDSIARLETMVMMAGMDLSASVVRRQIASALDVLVHLQRLRDGTRRVVCISEFNGMEGDVAVMQDVFVYREWRVGEDGRVEGETLPTGIRPRVCDRIEQAGLHLPPDLFLRGAPAGAWAKR